jgi:peptidoglycan L-alanyl-D-glutamate endopeptidase CwlK
VPVTAWRFSARSLARLQGVHPDLVRVVHRAIRITPIDFVVLEGLRTEARQRELVAAGASRTMRSRHLTGHAVDIAPWVGTVRWDWPLFHQLAPAIKQAAKDEGVPVNWGGDWRTFKDGPHWELARSRYP